MRRVRVPKLKLKGGRHAPSRSRRPEPERYQPRHRGRAEGHGEAPIVPARARHRATPDGPSAAVSRGRTAHPRKLTPLDNRPYETNAPKSPRERFRNADPVKARIAFNAQKRSTRDQLAIRRNEQPKPRTRNPRVEDMGQPQAKYVGRARRPASPLPREDKRGTTPVPEQRRNPRTHGQAAPHWYYGATAGPIPGRA